ncbi:hypothetical protein BJQ94_08075 [Cryobacterium sp. SO2]|uniref:hypothetical protein n=1 Tax=Cryobacterium sp. SO2 TaxID=1897060 RepID=UPI00223E7017|nr:hypothetical protein [Cryobacterium sp. SO2]WEO78981.1 hypothetical protein BJQ94_08075 [Cryobacterium sp. SO2]
MEHIREQGRQVSTSSTNEGRNLPQAPHEVYFDRLSTASTRSTDVRGATIR